MCFEDDFCIDRLAPPKLLSRDSRDCSLMNTTLPDIDICISMSFLNNEQQKFLRLILEWGNRRKILRRWWRGWRKRMNASINMKRIEELVFWTTNESWEQFIIQRRNTNYEVFLGQHCIKPVGCHYVRGQGKP